MDLYSVEVKMSCCCCFVSHSIYATAVSILDIHQIISHNKRNTKRERIAQNEKPNLSAFCSFQFWLIYANQMRINAIINDQNATMPKTNTLWHGKAFKKRFIVDWQEKLNSLSNVNVLLCIYDDAFPMKRTFQCLSWNFCSEINDKEVNGPSDRFCFGSRISWIINRQFSSQFGSLFLVLINFLFPKI